MYNNPNAAEEENKARYEQALQLLETGEIQQAYRLLYAAKGYSLANQKLEELRLEDYTVQYRYAEVGDTVKIGRFEQDNHTENGSEEFRYRAHHHLRGGKRQAA